MSKESQRKIIKQQREELVQELEVIYLKAFEKLTRLNLNEASLARLTQLILNSREAAITILQKKIEAPLITKAPVNSLEKSQRSKE